MAVVVGSGMLVGGLVLAGVFCFWWFWVCSSGVGVWILGFLLGWVDSLPTVGFFN